MLDIRPSDLIREGWIQHDAALDRHGDPCNPMSPMATRWDMGGAILMVYQSDTKQVISIHKALRFHLGLPENALLSKWNDDDERTHQEVLDALMAVGA